jgi:hypothetical protein
MFGNSKIANMANLELEKNNVSKSVNKPAVMEDIYQEPLINIQKPEARNEVAEKPVTSVKPETLAEIEKIAEEVEADENKIFGIQKKYFYGGVIIALAAVAIYFINKK